MDRTELRGAATTGLGVLAVLVFITILYPAPSAILFLGLVLGSLSALVAMGLVLIYRANRIVNFAQGDMGAMASVLAASLYVGPKLPFFVCVAIGLAAALLTGFIVEVGVIRRFSSAPRLVLTVAPSCSTSTPHRSRRCRSTSRSSGSPSCSAVATC
jgi:branched-chain amino acid transport system permease protein